MRSYSRSQLTDGDLLRTLVARVAQDCATTAELLADLAEFDARKLYLPASYPSMFLYCVHQLRLSEDAAYKRIQAARTARRFPVIFEAVADGRLHLSAVVMLAPHLNLQTAEGLLAAAAHKSKAQIEQLLAQSFPRPDVPTRLQPIAPPLSPNPPTKQLAPGRVESPMLDQWPLAAKGVAATISQPRVTPLAPQRFALQLTIDQSTYDNLRYAQELLGHQIPSGDIGKVFECALKALIGQLERRKFAATHKPRGGGKATMRKRHIPAAVRRAVWKRDSGQCTFRSEAGHRCAARTRLEYDHVEPVARGGRATVENIRLRCRSHNQYGAELAFGTDFMEGKRQAAQREAKATAERAKELDKEMDVVPWLRRLGFSVQEARRAAALCEPIPDAPLEKRVRVALSYFHSSPSVHVSSAP